ncbi:MAG: ArsR family transcriptional regulator [Nitrosopumilus sp.]|nr:MAG: ArsR family transcriptional regulator [Nitrosopumilus sp.]
MESKEKDVNFHKIKVFSSYDEKLKLLGELLSNKSSRNIIKLLMDGEYYTNEIANKLDLRPNLVIHHLKKLEELGLLEITNKKIVKKGNQHRYFKINPSLLITPKYTKDEIKKNGIFQKMFRDGIKFSLIAVSSILSWFALQPEDGPGAPNIDDSIVIDPIIVSLTIVIIGLVLEVIHLRKKKKKDY